MADGLLLCRSYRSISITSGLFHNHLKTPCSAFKRNGLQKAKWRGSEKEDWKKVCVCVNTVELWGLRHTFNSVSEQTLVKSKASSSHHSCIWRRHFFSIPGHFISNRYKNKYAKYKSTIDVTGKEEYILKYFSCLKNQIHRRPVAWLWSLSHIFFFSESLVGEPPSRSLLRTTGSSDWLILDAAAEMNSIHKPCCRENQTENTNMHIMKKIMWIW